MKFQRRQLVAAMAGLMLGLSAGAASAMGGPSGAAVGMPAQGHIGEVTSRIVCSSMHPPFSQSATACLGSSGCSTLK